MTRSRPTLLAFAGLLLLATVARPALAARVGPEPVLAQLADGYGIVAAEVVRAKEATKRGEIVDSYDVTFSVREIFVQPIVGGDFPLAAGDAFDLRLSSGYGAQLEFEEPQKLVAGQKFILSIKRDAAGHYAHVDGASAPVAVKAFTNEDRARFARLRELALVPAASRVDALLRVIANPAEGDAVRSDALAGFSDLSPLQETPERQRVMAGLLKVWNDPNGQFSLPLLSQLDFELRWLSRNTFDGTDDRARTWIKRLLDPTPQNLADDNSRDNLALGILRDILTRNPKAASPAIVPMVGDARWPEGFRRVGAAAILWAYVASDAPDAEWEPTLQRHFARVFRSKQAWPIRLAATDLSAMARYPRSVRRFEPNGVVRDAMQQAISDMKAATATDSTSQAKVAVREVEDAIRSLPTATSGPTTTQPTSR